MYDIVISGGGPAGATAARYLAKHGKKVILFQSSFNFKKPCGGGLRSDAWDEFDLDRKYIERVVKVFFMETEKEKIKIDLLDIPLAIVDRKRFDRYLRDLAEESGADVVEGNVFDLKKESDGYEVTIHLNGKVERIKTKTIIAADGVSSKIRKKLTGRPPARVLTVYSDVEDMETDACHFYLGSKLAGNLYGWKFPYKNGSDIGAIEGDGKDDFLMNIMKKNGIENHKTKKYYIPKWEDPLFYHNGVYFVGDAAGQVMPFTYEGIYYAMKSAKILANTIIDNTPEMYEMEWRRLYYKKFATLKKLEKFFLKSDFRVGLMMGFIRKKSIQNKMLLLWLDKYQLKVDIRFFLKVFHTMFR